MITILIVGAWCAFLLWRMRRAAEDAAEHVASGLARDPLYWVGSTMALTVLGLAMYMAHDHMGFTGVGRWFWVGELTLIVAALLIRRTLKWRYGY
ncbi:conserved membrane hypothetical protein [Bradyrhizobium oligotrophicum S58]|uniref:Uncharacterized protein n=1 Tax=Bradyrhizobium oligotrophicum S58 TaxID=1245469 RepID=M4Z2Q3_9BRAD|nr:hypothetical protein [Bradyrhizobium oligotrophicum]BAM87032.1 conserved membrane hypothetical protein [Bradyrhizobium oligotrophicum S58]